MAKSQLTVISPDPIEHAHQLIDLCAKTFGRFYDFRRDLRDWYLLNSHYDWQASSVGFLDGMMVTHFGVWGYDMRIGSAKVRCGGIGCVATDGEYRKRGLMAKTIPHSINLMRQRGYDLSILFGVWGFYHRFGYTRAWNEETWTISVDSLPKDLPSVRYSSIEAKPDPRIAELHNRYNANVTGSAIRPTFHRGHCMFSGKLEAYAWKKGTKLVGHVHIDASNRLTCHEATGEVDEILSVLCKLARKKQAKEIVFNTLPYNSPLARRLRQLNCKVDRQYIKSGGAMVRLINLESCLHKMAPELSRRLKASELDDYRGNLAITSPEGSAELVISRGKVSVISKPKSRKNSITGGDELAQLIIGTDDPLEICESGGIRLAGDARRLVKVLFPNEHPQLHQADRY